MEEFVIVRKSDLRAQEMEIERLKMKLVNVEKRLQQLETVRFSSSTEWRISVTLAKSSALWSGADLRSCQGLNNFSHWFSKFQGSSRSELPQRLLDLACTPYPWNDEETPKKKEKKKRSGYLMDHKRRWRSDKSCWTDFINNILQLLCFSRADCTVNLNWVLCQRNKVLMEIWKSSSAKKIGTEWRVFVLLTLTRYQLPFSFHISRGPVLFDRSRYSFIKCVILTFCRMNKTQSSKLSDLCLYRLSGPFKYPKHSPIVGQTAQGVVRYNLPI